VAKPNFFSTNEMALFSAISFVEGGYMKKKRVKCPVCGVYFDPRIPYQHISAHHAHASDHELSLIRNARRQCFGNAKPIKQKAIFLLVPSCSTVRHPGPKITAG